MAFKYLQYYMPFPNIGGDFNNASQWNLNRALEEADHLKKGDFHPSAIMWRNTSVTHKRMILRLMSGLKGKGEGKVCWLSRLSLWSNGVSSPSSPSCCCHVGRVWMSTNWERAPRGSIPAGTTGWISKQPRCTRGGMSSYNIRHEVNFILMKPQKSASNGFNNIY